MLKNVQLKQEALKLRKEGMLKAEITKKTGLSRATLTRLFHKNGDVKEVVNEPLKNLKPEDKKLNLPIKSELRPPEVKSGYNVTGISINKDGSLNISQGINKNINPVKPTTLKPKPDSADEKPGGAQQFKEAPESRKRDIDEPENVMDKFFTRGTAEILVPVGLLVAGYFMGGKKGSKDGFREDNGGDDW